jgi:citrate lyase gamma subunit
VVDIDKSEALACFLHATLRASMLRAIEDERVEGA